MSEDCDLEAPAPPKKTIEQLRAEVRDKRKTGRIPIPAALRSGNMLQMAQTMLRQAGPEQKQMMNQMLGSSITQSIQNATSLNDLESSIDRDDINKTMGKFQKVMEKAGPSVQKMADQLSEQVTGSKDLVTNMMVAKNVNEVEILMKGSAPVKTQLSEPAPVNTEAKKKKKKKKKRNNKKST